MRSIHITTILIPVLVMLGNRCTASMQSWIPSEKYAKGDSLPNAGQNVRLLFWNVENLFDYRDDTTTLDEEFTVEGTMHWSYTRLLSKIVRLAKVILAAGGWEPPGIIGLCEVENRYVLNKLVYESPLKPFGYRIIHRESPDPRGIDVAMLYRPALFTPVFCRWIPVRAPSDTSLQTREILYVKGVLLQRDTLHLFINHWPSRRGGEKASAPRRALAASVLRGVVDSLRDSNPYLLIMGDFNDEPEDESVRVILGARHPDSIVSAADLVNLMRGRRPGTGSHKFQGKWGMLDQLIVSGSFLPLGSPLTIDPSSAVVFTSPFLLEEDPRYLGRKPVRTFVGPRYRGGVSDHLPVMVEVRVN